MNFQVLAKISIFNCVNVSKSVYYTINIILDTFLHLVYQLVFNEHVCHSKNMQNQSIYLFSENILVGCTLETKSMFLEYERLFVHHIPIDCSLQC